MKRILVFPLFFFLAFAVQAQPFFNLGLKGGVHFSDMNIDTGNEWLELDSESIVKTHWGAFARVGISSFYVQPEVYFSKKGGDLSSGFFEVTSGFDYSNVDVPLLFGYKIIDKPIMNLRVMAGPVFSYVVDADYPSELEDYLSEDFFNDHVWGLQYGVGVDVLFLTLDARFEHGSKVYDDPEVVSGKNTTFMLSLGFKIL